MHKGVQKKPNLDEECEALLEDKRCKFHNNAQKLYGMQASSSLQARLHGVSAQLPTSTSKGDLPRIMTAAAGLLMLQAAERSQILHAVLLLLQVHDIEDLVKVGQSMQACPYFAARHFKGASCPNTGQSEIAAQSLLVVIIVGC